MSPKRSGLLKTFASAFELKAKVGLEVQNEVAPIS